VVNRRGEVELMNACFRREVLFGGLTFVNDQLAELGEKENFRSSGRWGAGVIVRRRSVSKDRGGGKEGDNFWEDWHNRRVSKGRR